MKSVWYSLLLLLTALAISCQKVENLPFCQGKCTTITGRLVTGQPQVGIAGATVTAKWLVPTSFGARATIKARTITAPDGTYQLSFFMEDNELTDGYFSVFYAVDKNQYYTIGDPEDAFFKLKRDTTVTTGTFVIPRRAYVRLAITNSVQLSNKGLFISNFNTCYGHNNVFSQAIQGGGPVVFWEDLPAESPLSVAGDQSLLVKSSRTKNGVTTYTTDSLFIPSGTTGKFSVTY